MFNSEHTQGLKKTFTVVLLEPENELAGSERLQRVSRYNVHYAVGEVNQLNSIKQIKLSEFRPRHRVLLAGSQSACSRFQRESSIL